MDITLALDLEKFKPLLSDFCRTTGLAATLVDLRGRVILQPNGQRVCLEFHRRHPESLKACVAGEAALAKKLSAGQAFALHTCRNGLTDCASPVIINGTHVADLFLGPFFLKAPDRTGLQERAIRYAFDRRRYEAAVADVPILSKHKVQAGLRLLVGLAELMGEGEAPKKSRLASHAESPEATILGSKDQQTPLEDQVRERAAALEREVLSHHATEEELRASEAKFSVAFHACPMALLISSSEDGRILEANESFCRMLGYGSEDLRDLSLSDLNLWADPDIGEKLNNTLSLLGTVYDLELQLRHKSNQTFWALVSIVSITLKGERCLLTMIFNIDEQKRASRDIQESEERFRILFEDAPEAYYLSDLAGNFVDGNRKAEEFTGYGKDELIGKSFFDLNLVTPDQHPRMAELLNKSLQGLATGPDEIVLTRKDGTRGVAEVITRPVAIRNQRLVLGLARDITDRKKILKDGEKLLQEVRDSEQRLRWALQAGGGGAWDWDLISGGAWWSAEMYDLWGVPPGTPMNAESSFVIVRADDRQFVQDNIAEAIAQHTEMKYEFRILRPGGEERWMMTSGRIIYDASGRAVRIIGITTDITERKQTEETLERSRDRLEEEVRKRTADLEKSRRAALSLMQDANIQRQRAEKAREELARSEQDLIKARDEAQSANRAKSAFLATMSHEIRTPMNAVVSLAYLTFKTGLTPKQRDYLQKMLNASLALQRTIEDTLDFSKIEAGRLELEDIAFSLDFLQEELIAVLQTKANNKGIRLVFNEDPNVPKGLRGDPLRLGQILVNLIDNAIKFTESGRITVATRLEAKDEDHVILRFSIKDTGIGMTETQVSRLFQPFTQADATITRKYGGTGLGLAISKRLVEMMNGQITVQSRPGQGSEFVFTARLGLAPAAGHLIPKESARGEEAVQSLAGARVLLVEDNEINREVGRELLESVGLVVDTAENGKRAVKKVKPGKYDLILMDIKMPVMDGVEATRIIRQDPHLESLPILSMTADVMAGDLDAYRLAGINDNLSKPIDPIKLFGVLAQWIKPGNGAGREKKRSRRKASPPARASLELGELPGIDIESGLARVSGNVGLYRKLLHKFRSLNLHAAHRIQKALDKGDFSLAKRLTHNLKGVSGNIGADGLFQASSELNQALKREKTENLTGMLASLTGNLDEVMTSIARLDREGEPPGSESRATDGVSLTQLLPKLARSIEASDLEALDALPELKTLLRGTEHESRAEALQEALDHFQFEEALEALTKLARKFKISLGDDRDDDDEA